MHSHAAHTSSGHSHDINVEQDHGHQSEQQQEESYFKKVLHAFKSYKKHAFSILDHKTREWNRADFESKERCLKYQKKLLGMKDCIEANAVFLDMLIPQDEDDDASVMKFGKMPSPTEMDKVRSVLRQFVRDWSAQGAEERNSSYSVITKALVDHFSAIPVEGRGDIHVLVPGAGLGRLAFDIAKLGFTCQGNEYSFYMLLASNFVLNMCQEPEQFTLHPWVHSFSNHRTIADQIQAVRIPDVLPCDIPPNVGFSMVAGEFLEVYGDQPESWDVVVTCFFLDTAHDIVSYVDLIQKILKPNGLWINFGPLLYHFEDSHKEASLELTLEELMDVVTSFGLKVQEEKMVKSTYTGNKASMLSYVYDCSFFTAVKSAATQ